MTEDDAKTKWCPMVRIGIGEGSVANRSWVSSPEDLPKMDNHCIGSDCMMWRWDESRATAAGIEAGVAHGYCGVAPLYMSAPSQPLQGMSVPASIMRGKMGEPIGKGVYSNPQPGDADHGK